MAISKLILNGEVQMDVTSDTVTAGSMISGTTATKNDGTKVTGTIASKSSTDMTVSGATVTAPAGYYSSSASKSVATMTLPTTTSTSATSGYTAKATLDRSTSDRYINIGTGYNSAGGYYKINKVANGTAGTPTATKGTVSNHSVSVTPSVTNTTGYITGGTKTGTAVTVTASELVSGTKSITENGTGVDVTNYASVDVAVESAASSYTYIGSTTYTVSTTSTTSISVGTFATGDTSIWTYDKMVYVKIRDVAGPRVGYYYGCDAFFYNAPPPAGSSFTTTGAMCGNMYTVPASNGRIVSTIATLRSDSTASTTGYGIYPTWLHSNGDIDIKARYSSTSTGKTYTIDGTYSVEVYLLDWPGGIAPYQE